MAKSSLSMGREISLQKGKGKGKGKGKTPERTATRETEIWKHVEQAIILGGTQTQNREKFMELVKEGCFIREETAQEVDTNQEGLIGRDSDVDIADEDDVDFEIWENKGKKKTGYCPDDITLKTGNMTKGEEDDSPLFDSSHELYELVVDGTQCKFSTPDWVAGYWPYPHGENANSAFNLKFDVFRAISKWLETERPKFLRSMDWLDLGPKDYGEVLSKQVTVVQKYFLDVILDLLKKNTKITGLDESVFSRCVNTGKIVWPNGSLPVKDLFCEEAKMGWVAKSIMLFMQRHGHSTDVIINRYCDMKMRKGTAEKQKILNGNIDSMDVDQFIRYANLVAGTTWEKVLNTHFKRGGHA